MLPSKTLGRCGSLAMLLASLFTTWGCDGPLSTTSDAAGIDAGDDSGAISTESSSAPTETEDTEAVVHSEPDEDDDDGSSGSGETPDPTEHRPEDDDDDDPAPLPPETTVDDPLRLCLENDLDVEFVEFADDGTFTVRCRGATPAQPPPAPPPTTTGTTPIDPPPVDPPITPETLCSPVRTSEVLPARASVMSNTGATPQPQGILVRDVYNRFRSWCGACHVDFSLGNFQVNLTNFTQLMTRQKIDQSMKHPDRALVMPPGGPLFHERPAGDPVVELYNLLIAWRTAVDPLVQADPNANPEVFFPPAPPPSSGGSTSPYALTPELGTALTNLGSCIPDPALVNTEATLSLELDTKFASMTQLPRTLQETDLINWDSYDLARHGVISYAPTYTLFSDDAGKMRHVRVPRGQSVEFDRATQSFKIPPNTRFYKTFLKKVKDSAGNEGRWRKIETRIIVSRPDAVLPDGTRQPTAIFGTYQWDPTETQAVLVEDPLRNGQPFRDRVFQYLVDEVAGQELLDQAPPNVNRKLAEERLARSYGIPGSQRCIDCHRGSENASFILGFGPLQVNRLPMSDGVETNLHGIYEAPGTDELTQLQRLIDYGIITGITNPSDPTEVWPLELTQDVLPRTKQELEAQGYMIGNCAFCHNPHGLASFENPVLRDVLNFWPDQQGGIFGFPLDEEDGRPAFSPRIKRGPGGNMRIPYVSPDLNDRGNTKLGLPAPWRSLIYRNVDTPFTYYDDEALFPKMPLHVPGYDPRAPRIMGEWMASLPARAKSIINEGTEQTHEEVFEGESGYAAALTEAEDRLAAYRAGPRYDCREYVTCTTDQGNCFSPCIDTRDIVAHEVLLAIERNTDGLTPELFTPLPVPVRPHWVDTDLTEPELEHWAPRRPDWFKVLLCGNGRVDLGNLVSTTDDEECDDGPLGSDTCTATCRSIACGSDDLSPEEQQECQRAAALNPLDPERMAVELLRDIELTDDFRELVLGERPMALWDDDRTRHPTCNFSGMPTIQTYSGAGPTQWFSEVQVTDRGKPLYFQSPGEAIFTSICANCHGPNADSQGRQAITVALMSGGETRVANLRDGLLGLGSIDYEFGPFTTPGVTNDDLAARYMSWMALGGTQRKIPKPVLEMVRKTRVYGYARIFPQTGGIATPNMLESAVDICAQLLGRNTADKAFLLDQGGLNHSDAASPNSALLGWTGDAEMWRDICTYDNPAPILVVRQDDGWQNQNAKFTLRGTYRSQSSEGRPLYVLTEGDPAYPVASGATTPPLPYVGNHLGDSLAIEGGAIPGHPEMRLPWCVIHPTAPTELTSSEQEQALKLINAHEFAAAWEAQHTGKFPFCPTELLSTLTPGGGGQPTYTMGPADIERWARRGAINAGLAVFSYLKVVREGLLPKPGYDRCEER